jgi:sugar/nucleoside kinase (ribokinase family)
MSSACDILCAGIVVADHVSTPISHLPAAGELVMADRLILTLGGCAANVAVGLRKLGVAAAVVGRVGDDLFGRIVRDMLAESRVDVRFLQGTPGTDTSQTLIVNVAGQDRRFIHTFGANAVFRAADVPRDRLAACKVLYLGGYLLMGGVTPEETAAVFAEARRLGAKTVLDVVTPPGADYLARLAPVLPHVDVFLPNADEAKLITGEADPLRQAERFRSMGAGTVVVTLGGDGSVLADGSRRLRAAAYPVEFVDGTGGGDAFAAGYIDGLLRGLATEDCLRVASALGASCVRAVGTTPGVFTRPELDAFLRGHELRIELV